MEEQKIVSEQDNVATADNNEYLDMIKELKTNSVPKTEYEKLKAENTRIVKDFMNNQPAPQATAEVKESINDLRQNAFAPSATNLQFWDNALKLRNRLIEEGQEDPFVPQGNKISATYEDREAAQRVADVIQQCIDYADGDSQLFTNELQRRTVDLKR